MPKITFIEPGGNRRELEIGCGENLMHAARAADVVGILAECGGCCACATCQVIVSKEWIARMPEPDIMEASMLDDDVQTCRLCCQLTATDELDGLVVEVPASQH